MKEELDELKWLNSVENGLLNNSGWKGCKPFAQKKNQFKTSTRGDIAIVSLISYGIGYSSQMKAIYDRMFFDNGARSEAIGFTYAQAHQQILRSATYETIYHQMEDIDHFVNQLTILDKEFNQERYSQECYPEETDLVLYDPTEALRKFSHLFFLSYLFVLWQSLR